MKKQYPDWIVEAHKGRKSFFRTRTCARDDWGYKSEDGQGGRYHPQQIVIEAAGWPAKILTWIFRIKPCLFTGTNEVCWPKPDLMK